MKKAVILRRMCKEAHLPEAYAIMAPLALACAFMSGCRIEYQNSTYVMLA